MAENMYHEARNESTAGLIAVGNVVLNRVKSEYFPDEICKVIYEGPHKVSWKDPTILIPIPFKCQFSWYCDGKKDVIANKQKYIEIHALATRLILGNIPDITDGALHYHATYVNPGWASKMTITTKIDQHIFYKW